MAAINLSISSGILSLLVGLLVLFFPKLLRWGIGIYLIIIGLLSFFV